jgi:hypothetical protein
MAALVEPSEVARVLGWPEGSDLTDLEQPCDAADHIVATMLDENLGPHDQHAWDREAALAVAVQITNARTSPGGQMQALDFTPVTVPHLLGPGLIARVQGLVRPCRTYGGLVVG